MGVVRDLMGQKFGYLSVESPGTRRELGKTFWWCRCERCNGTAEVERRNLLSGKTLSCGCLKRDNHIASLVDETGNVYGRLTIAGMASERSSNRSVMWNAICACGVIKKVSANTLRFGRVNSCGCTALKEMGEKVRERHEKKRKETGSNPAKKEVFMRYRMRASRKGIPFELTHVDFERITTSSCWYCGIAPSQTCKRHGYVFNYNGIDRVVPALGYVAGNCVAACRVCNMAKGSQTVEEFKTWLQRISSVFGAS